MAWCLTRDQESKFRDALVSKDIDPFKLADMTSVERRTLFEKYVDGENAVNINSLFESKLLLKNQQQGFKTWAKRALGMSPKVNRDLLSKIERLDEIGVLEPKDLKAFKEDLARTRLGFGITFEEAKTINTLSEARVEAKERWGKELDKHPEWKKDPHETRKEWINNSVGWEYGLKQDALISHVTKLQDQAKAIRISFKEEPVRFISNEIKAFPVRFSNLLKSLGATADDSLYGRQGIPNLYGTPAQKRIWGRNFVDSFSKMASELRRSRSAKGLSPMNFVRAGIYMRPNAMNGKYKVGDFGLNVLHEEVIPTSSPGRIPFFGRLFRASETMFSAGSLQMRADLADLNISKMDKQGINTLNPKEMRPVGNMIGSLTGRGKVEATQKQMEVLNFVFWSVRFFKANVDMVMAPAVHLASKTGIIDKGTKGKQFARAEASKNMLLIIAHIAAINMFAKWLDPDSVDEDPRNTNFGRVKIFGKWTNISSGMGAIAVLAARIIPTIHDGELGYWSKSSSGKWTRLDAGNFGQRDGVDVILDTIFLNKLAPVASIYKDSLKGELFGGEPFDIKKSIVNSAIPFSIQAVDDVKDESFATILGVAISEFFGLSVSTYKYADNWEKKTSKEMKQFKEQVGKDKFKDANESYNRVYNAWFEEVQKDKDYKELSEDGKSSLKSSAKSAIKKKILDEYGYDSTEEPDTLEELKEKDVIEELKPLQSLVDKAVKAIAKIDLVSDAIASEGKEGMNPEQRTRFDEIKERISGLVDLVASRKKSELLSPQRIDVLTDEVKRLTKEGEDLLTAPALPEEPIQKEHKVVNNIGKNPKFSEVKPADSVDTAIRGAAEEFDVPSELLFDIAFAESSLDPTKQNDKSTAGGLFQFLKLSWEQAMRELGLPEDTPKTDEVASARAAAMVISKGRLSWWDASKKDKNNNQRWGDYYTDEELKLYDRRLKK